MLYVIVGKYAGLAQKNRQFTTLVRLRDQLEAGGVGLSLSLSLSNVMRMLQTGRFARLFTSQLPLRSL